MSSFTVSCPHCNQALEADDSLVGKTVECPACGKPFDVPAPQEPKPALQLVAVSATTVSNAGGTLSEASTPQQQHGTGISIFCPHCGNRLLSADASLIGRYVDCPSCAKRFRAEAATNSGAGAPSMAKPPLSMTTAIVFMALSCIPYVGCLFLIPALVFAMILHYRCWAALPAEYARTTPGKAVGYLFIPFYGIYWAFPSFLGLVQDCKAFANDKSLRVPGSLSGLGLTLSILFSLLFYPFFVNIPAFVVWLLFYLNLTRFLNRLSR